MRTTQREEPSIPQITRKIEGPGHIYPYLKGLNADIRKEIAPKLIDCLNCEKGCNGGPAPLCGISAWMNWGAALKRETIKLRDITKNQEIPKKIWKVCGRYWNPTGNRGFTLGITKIFRGKIP